MAATEEERDAIVELDEEEEGNLEYSADYFFAKIGEPVPLKAGNSSFDLQSAPAKPLAVSDRFQAVFVAHLEGFYVAKTKDVIEAAKEIMKKKSRSCIEELCVVNVPIGKVHILALSMDSLTLAACVGSHIHFFSVFSLLDKERETSFSCSIDESSHVKDFHWRKKSGNSSYVVLSRHGVLYQGKAGGPLKEVMDKVDAVDWSARGNSIVVARRNILTILSSKFRERFSMSLTFNSWATGSDKKAHIKVDTIKWVRSNCILLGCFQLTEDGNEDGYVVQIITCRDGKITKDSKLVVLSFSDVFQGIIHDILPFGSGPYLFLNYLEHWELAFAANRKNTDQHVVLFGWSLNEQKEAAVIELSQDDRWLPRIGLQENEDENLIMGFGVDKVSLYEKVKVILGVEERELSPYCILLCLTLEGKLTMFYVAGVSENPVPSQIVSELSDEEEDSLATVTFSDDLSKTALRLEEHKLEGAVLDNKSQGASQLGLTTKADSEVLVEKELDDCGKSSSIVDDVSNSGASNNFNASHEPFGKTQGLLLPLASNTGQKTHSNLEVSKKDGHDANLGLRSCAFGQQSSYIEKLPINSSSVHGLDSANRAASKSETQKPVFSPHAVGLKTDFPSMPILSTIQSNNKFLFKSSEMNKDFFGGNESTSSKIASSEPESSRKLPTVDDLNARPPFFSLSSTEVNQLENSGSRVGNIIPGSSSQSSSFGLMHRNMANTKEPTTHPQPSTYSSGRAIHIGQRSLAGAGKFESLPSFHSSNVVPHGSSMYGNSQYFKLQPVQENLRTLQPSSLSTAEPELSKHFSSVNDMVKDLDTLLSYIEKEGGFRDACTVFQKGSVLALEQGLEDLSRQCRVFKNIMEDRQAEIQCLLDKVVQVLARKIYIESIFKQASDGQHWDLWYRQKLSPELELKHKQILKLNQDLTSQLIHLERHFNSLELNRFSETSGASRCHKVFHTGLEPSRDKQSVHSLYNTMNSQLAAAEQLSDCLSKQMALLNIESSSLKKQSVAKELFESIGLDYDGDRFKSPAVKSVGRSPESYNKPYFHSSSAAITKQFGRQHLSATKNSEPETARRRRDSLEQNWANFEPSKTTVKRISLQEERIRIEARESSMLTENEMFASPLLQDSDRARDYTTPHHSNSSINKHELNRVQADHGQSQSISLKSPAVQVTQRSNTQSLSSVVPALSSHSIFPDEASDAWSSVFNQSSIDGNFVKSDSSKGQSVPFLMISDLQSEAPLSYTPPTSTSLPAQRVTSPWDPSNLKSGVSQARATLVSASHNVITSENSFVKPVKGQNSLFPSVSSFPAVATLDGNFSQIGTVTSRADGDAAVSSPFHFFPIISSSSMSPSSSSMTLFSGPLTSTGPSTDVNQRVSFSASSSLFSSSSISFPVSSSPIPTLSPKDQVSPFPSSASINKTPQIPPTKPEPVASPTEPNLAAVSKDSKSLEGESGSNSVNIMSQIPPTKPDPVASPIEPKLAAASKDSKSLEGESKSVNIMSQAPPTKPEPVASPTEPKLAALSKDSKSFEGESGSKSDVNISSKASAVQSEPPSGEFSSNSAISVTSAPLTKVSASFASGTQPNFTNVFSAASIVSSTSQTDLPSGTRVQLPERLSSSSVATDGRNETLDLTEAEEDEMEEEASDTTTGLNLGSLDGFGLGSAPTSSASKPNPFGGTFQNTTSNQTPFTLTVPSGEMFRPASFNFQPVQPSQPTLTVNQSAFSGGFNSVSPVPAPTGSAFGQPAHLGPGQQALGSVLGAFGQSRQLGTGPQGTGFASASGFGVPSTGGFANAATGGGFAGAPSAGGFANAAAGGGFAGVASAGGGFAGAASGSTGFAPAVSGGGFGGAAASGGGFGAFNKKQGSGGFSAFGNSAAGSGKASGELFTQMRR